MGHFASPKAEGRRRESSHRERDGERWREMEMARGEGEREGKRAQEVCGGGMQSALFLPSFFPLSDLLALFPIVGTQLCSQRARGPVGAEPEVFSWGTEEGGGRGVRWTN